MAARIARRSADNDGSFGWYRAEKIGAAVNGALLLAMALFVIGMAAMRLSAPIDLPTGPMLWTAVGSLVTEFIALGSIWREGRRDLNTRGAIWHVIQTFVGSFFIIIRALVIRLTAFLLIASLLEMALPCLKTGTRPYGFSLR